MKKALLIICLVLIARVLTCDALDFERFLTISKENRTLANQIVEETYLWRIVVTPGNMDAITWYDRESLAGNAEAQFGLATLYFKGMGKPKDRYQAARWFESAANQGHASSQFMLGYIYLHGLGVPQNKRIACDWFEKAAAQGDPNAQFNLASLYFSGEGIPEHFIKGLKWYAVAASQGHVYAQNMLGTVYNHGIGVAMDNIAAYVWWSMADTSNKLTTRSELKLLKQRMTQAELEIAQETSSRCFQSKFQDCEPSSEQLLSTL